MDDEPIEGIVGEPSAEAESHNRGYERGWTDGKQSIASIVLDALLEHAFDDDRERALAEWLNEREEAFFEVRMIPGFEYVSQTESLADVIARIGDAMKKVQP